MSDEARHIRLGTPPTPPPGPCTSQALLPPQGAPALANATATCTGLTFLEQEALVRQLQGLLVHVDVDGRLLVLTG